MSLKIVTQKELNELIEWLKPYTPNERLEMILEAARTVNIPELEAAIEMYRESALTEDDYFGEGDE